MEDKLFNDFDDPDVTEKTYSIEDLDEDFKVSKSREYVTVDPETGRVKVVEELKGIKLDCGHNVSSNLEVVQCYRCGAWCCTKCYRRCKVHNHMYCPSCYRVCEDGSIYCMTCIHRKQIWKYTRATLKGIFLGIFYLIYGPLWLVTYPFHHK